MCITIVSGLFSLIMNLPWMSSVVAACSLRHGIAVTIEGQGEERKRGRGKTERSLSKQQFYCGRGGRTAGGEDPELNSSDMTCRWL